MYEIAKGINMVYEIYDCCQNSLCINWKNDNTMNCSLTKEDFINCKQVRYYHKKPLATIVQQPLSEIKTSDSLENKLETSHNSDHAKSCKNCKHESFPQCPAHGDRFSWGWDSKKDYCGRHDFA